MYGQTRKSVRNRVNECKRIADILKFKFLYIRSEDNPADIITKYVPGALESELWRRGPDIIRDPSRWKEFVPGPTNTSEVPLAIGQTSVNPDIHSKDFPNISEFTSLEQIYQQSVKLRGLKYNVENVTEIGLLWFKEVQEKYFSDILIFF